MSINFNSGIEISLAWDSFKKYINGDAKRLSLQYVNENGRYYLIAIDDQIAYTCIIFEDGKEPNNYSASEISDNTNDRNEFESDYKPYANKPLKQYVFLQDFSELDPEEFRAREEWHKIDVSTGVNPSVLNLTWKYDIAIEGGRSLGNWPNLDFDDYINAIIIPGDQNGDPSDGTVGALTSSFSAGDSVLDVSNTVSANLVPGDSILIGSEDFYYEVIKSDKVNDQITISPSLSEAKSASDPVKLHILSGKGIPILENCNNEIGYQNFGSMFFPKGSTLKIEYHHATTPNSNYKIPIGILIRHGRKI